MGSYRRGQSDCGDIDILVTRPDTDGHTHRGGSVRSHNVDVRSPPCDPGLMRTLLPLLHERGILTEDLSTPHDPDDLEAKYMGLCRLSPDNKMRRVGERSSIVSDGFWCSYLLEDILTVPFVSWGAALLYFVGPFLYTRRWIS